MPDRYVDPNSGAAMQPGGVAQSTASDTPMTAPAPVEPEAPAETAPEPEPEPEPEPAPEASQEDDGDEADEDEAEARSAPQRLDDMHRDQLIEIAGHRDVKGRHQMSRADLIAAIRGAS